MPYRSSMRAIETATTFCRLLAGLDRSGASGTLTISGSGRGARVFLAAGCVSGAQVDRRVATRQQHVRQELLRVCHWESARFRFRAEPSLRPHLELQAIEARALALFIMQRAVAEMNVCSVRAELGEGYYRLTAAGEALVSSQALAPTDSALIHWLRRGLVVDDVPSLPGCGPAAYRLLYALKLLRGAAPQGGCFPLLLRKRQQVRQNASAHALLDLPERVEAPEARRALRKLVRDLHPDRFGERAPQALRRASGEIVTALVAAEARITRGRTT